MRPVITGVLLSLAIALPAHAERQVSAVLGGENASGQPWMAALLRGRHADPWVGQFCGATLIAPEWALTAAHCFDKVSPADMRRLELLTGTTVLRRGEGERIPVEEVIVHPGFVARDAPAGVGFDNDIALLRLAEAAEGVVPIDLPGLEFDAMDVKPGASVLLLGWGATVYDNDSRRATWYPRDLQQARLSIVSGPDCVETMGVGEVTVNMFCAGDKLGEGPDSCVNDSGGPLAIAAPGPAGWRQTGIVSWGLGCALPGAYGVYTRLGRYAKWISDQVCEPGELPPRPRLTALTKTEATVTLEWPADDQGLRYRVYYRPLLTLSPVRHFDVGEARTFTSAAPPGVAYQVALQAYRGPCISEFSTLSSFVL